MSSFFKAHIPREDFLSLGGSRGPSSRIMDGMAPVKNPSTVLPVSREDYSSFGQLDGSHPLQREVPDSVVLYRVRTRKGGKVGHFNYALAKEIGLIGEDHPAQMNKKLEEIILHTFGIVIINEYDGINDIRYPKKEIRPNHYMATRYLQLQHPNKKGRTSGDGRSIWNGMVSHKGRCWDISSCGTGATILSPATSINDKFYQTGDPSISYGCGHSELDEGISTALFSEIMGKNNIPTERVLAVIDYGQGIGLTVRAHENLIRPSHMFGYLKQNDYDNLKSIVDYYIERQIKNNRWPDVPKSPKAQYRYFLKKVTRCFAEVASSFEDEYIFCWFDWDGDNILVDGSIIDYGSIRQFGLFHSEYRYDDVERYSTTIVEQKSKARYIVQTFAQMVDYLVSGKKKNIKSYAGSQAVREFEEIFEDKKYFHLAYKIGLNKQDALFLAKKRPPFFKEFRKAFAYFERAKSVEGIHEVADGINWNAIFCMRDILRELPQIYLSREDKLRPGEFIDIVKSTYAKKEDLLLSPYRRQKISDFQNSYREIISYVAKNDGTTFKKKLLEVVMRSSVINKYDRVTGDSITLVTDKIMNHRPKLTPDEIYHIFSHFIRYQHFDPDNMAKDKGEREPLSKLMRGMISIVRNYREGL